MSRESPRQQISQKSVAKESQELLASSVIQVVEYVKLVLL